MSLKDKIAYRVGPLEQIMKGNQPHYRFNLVTTSHSVVDAVEKDDHITCQARTGAMIEYYCIIAVKNKRRAERLYHQALERLQALATE